MDLPLDEPRADADAAWAAPARRSIDGGRDPADPASGPYVPRRAAAATGGAARSQAARTLPADPSTRSARPSARERRDPVDPVDRIDPVEPSRAAAPTASIRAPGRGEPVEPDGAPGASDGELESESSTPIVTGPKGPGATEAPRTKADERIEAWTKELHGGRWRRRTRP